MVKKSIYKKICFIMALIIMMSCFGINALAATKTKTVTTYTTYNYGGNETDAFNAFNATLPYMSQPKSYNDGQYTGTLNYTGYRVVSATPIQGAPAGIYYWTFELTFSGIVTAQFPDTKTVTTHTTYNYGGTETDAFDAFNATLPYMSQPKSYDDGQYKGTLNYTGYRVVSSTPIQGAPAGMYYWTFELTFSGTVTFY